MELSYYRHFFMPSPELTRKIVRVHNKLAYEDDLEDLHESDIAELDAEPENDLVEEDTLDSSGFGDVGSKQRFKDYRQLIAQRLHIAQSLHSYLAYLSRTPQAREQISFNIYEAIPRGMVLSLGLQDSSNRSQPLVKDLAREFHERMRGVHHGYFSAPWGEIKLVSDSEPLMLLIERQTETREPRPHYERAALRTAREPVYGGNK